MIRCKACCGRRLCIRLLIGARGIPRNLLREADRLSSKLPKGVGRFCSVARRRRRLATLAGANPCGQQVLFCAAEGLYYKIGSLLRLAPKG